MRVVAAASMWLALGGETADGASPGYRVTSTRVVVEEPEQWAAWEIPGGAYAISEAGAVEPLYLQRPTNAMLDAAAYERVEAGNDTVVGGVQRCGSRPEEAPRVIDGSMETFWEPDSDDDVVKWYVEVDLGRTVVAERVRVRFVPEGMGDPFLKFRVMLSDGIVRRSSDEPEFYRVGQVSYPNKEGREFEFEILPRRPLADGVRGDIAQLVRFEGLDTDGPRAAQVDAGEYEGMADSLRGAVDYYRQTIAGRQILVDEETYGDLPEEERGEVVCWRRERPRLAELEVITPGENIVVATQRRLNVETTVFESLIRHLTTDGLHSSYYGLRTYEPIRDKNQVEIDLGARFWLDRVRVLCAQVPLSAYQVRVSDGSVDPTGSLVWHAFDERLNRELHLQVEEQFPLREVRHLEVRRLEYVGSATEDALVSEIQAYGQGYVSEVTMTSPLMKLGSSQMLTDLRWEGEAPPGTELEIRTRSGDDTEIEVEYRDRYGRLTSKEAWEAAREENRGPKVEREVPGPGWSKWSEVYQATGEAVKSPSPRRMVQALVRLRTTKPERRPWIRKLRIGLRPPLVEQVVAEIWPLRDVPPGVDQEFTLYLRPEFARADAGFDRLMIGSTSSSPIELLSLVRAGAAEVAIGGGTDLMPEVTIRDRAGQGVEVELDEPVTAGGGVYAARIRTQVYLSGTTFWADLTRESRPGLVQRATEGDAVSGVASQSLVVTSDVGATDVLGEVEIAPSVVTPNGDGVNEEVEIRFGVFQATGRHLVEVGVHDLQGRRVRDLSVWRDEPSGAHALRWDGRNDGGQVVPPGIYVVVVRMEIDALARPASTGLVHVAY